MKDGIANKKIRILVLKQAGNTLVFLIMHKIIQMYKFKMLEGIY